MLQGSSSTEADKPQDGRSSAVLDDHSSPQLSSITASFADDAHASSPELPSGISFALSPETAPDAAEEHQAALELAASATSAEIDVASDNVGAVDFEPVSLEAPGPSPDSQSEAEAGYQGEEGVRVVLSPAKAASSAPLGPCQCQNVDVEEARAVAALFLPAIARSVIEQAAGELFGRHQSADKTADDIRKQLFEFLEKRSQAVALASPRRASAAVRPSPFEGAAGPPGGLTRPGLPTAQQPQQGLRPQPGGDGGAAEAIPGARPPAGDAAEGHATEQGGHPVTGNDSDGGSEGRADEASPRLEDHKEPHSSGREPAAAAAAASAGVKAGGPPAPLIPRTTVPPPPIPPLVSSPPQSASAAPSGADSSPAPPSEAAPPAAAFPSVAPPPRGSLLRTVATLLDEFVASRRPVLLRLSSVFLGGSSAVTPTSSSSSSSTAQGKEAPERGDDMSRQRVAAVTSALEEAGFWPMSHRVDLAHALIVRLDTAAPPLAHCGREFASLAELRGHQAGCAFREVRCANAGCDASVSWLRSRQHDEACGHKLLRCRQGCGQGVARAVMEWHCATDCPQKPMPCPYAVVGCSVPLVQCEVARHCAEGVQGHLQLAVALLAEVQSQQRVADTRLQLLEKSTTLLDRSLKVEVAELQGRVGETEKRVRNVEADVTRVKGELHSVGGLKHEVSSLRQLYQSHN